MTARGGVRKRATAARRAKVATEGSLPQAGANAVSATLGKRPTLPPNPPDGGWYSHVALVSPAYRRVRVSWCMQPGVACRPSVVPSPRAFACRPASAGLIQRQGKGSVTEHQWGAKADSLYLADARSGSAGVSPASLLREAMRPRRSRSQPAPPRDDSRGRNTTRLPQADHIARLPRLWDGVPASNSPNAERRTTRGCRTNGGRTAEPGVHETPVYAWI
jgi:hypothetical protein